MTKSNVVSVSLVLQRLATIIQTHANLDSVWIQGEISNLTKHRSGHYYFSIKDANGAMSCVMFSSYVRHIDFDVQEGMKVLVKADANIYPQRGSLQLYVKQMKQDGIGDLFREYERRKQMLEQKGYFRSDHKKSKPEWINNIAVITAKEGAAIQDVLQTIQRRWPMMKVTLFPALVQGNNAPMSMIRQIRNADAQGFDAILLVRGGGSFEDLFGFNDPNLVHTIYKCNTYIVSGVGHETDTTLCDLVSDHRSVTPTAAAQWVSLDQHEVLQSIQDKKDVLYKHMTYQLQYASSRLERIQSHPYMKDPMAWVVDKRLRLDGLEVQLEQQKQNIFNESSRIVHYQAQMIQGMYAHMERTTHRLETIQNELQPAMERNIENNHKKLQKNIALLDAYSPLKVMTRGYTMTRSDSKIIRSVYQVQTDDTLYTLVQDGTIVSKVIGKETDNGK